MTLLLCLGAYGAAETPVFDTADDSVGDSATLEYLCPFERGYLVSNDNSQTLCKGKSTFYI